MGDLLTNKVIFGGKILIDLTKDTVAKEFLLQGKTAHDKSGATIEGTCTYDVDSTDANALEAEILSGKSAYVKGHKVAGTMTNHASVTGTIDSLKEDYTIPSGFHDGGGTVGINADDKAKIIPANIKQGIEILGVTGICKPSSDVTASSKTVTPTKDQQTVLPEHGTDYLSQVIVEAIPYVETPNDAGGNTVTIAG